jgi:predicted AlkP superfamily phosphohydrolase/phosphomutase
MAMEKATKKRIGVIRYLRRFMRAKCYLKVHPKAPKDTYIKTAKDNPIKAQELAEMAQLTTMFNRNKWCRELGEGVVTGAEKISVINKVYKEVTELRKPNSPRRFGTIADRAATSYRTPSRFSHDQQSALLVNIRNQTWLGICDATSSINGRGELCCN